MKSQIVAPGNITTSFGYDAYGRQTAINDASAGNETREYDDMGNISRHTDANEQQTAYSYDGYGRLTQIQRPEFTTVYTYNEYSAPLTETSTNGTSRTLSYDEYGRVRTERECVSDSIVLRRTNSYTNESVTSVTYTLPDDTEIKETFSYINGHLTEMKELLLVRAVIEPDFPPSTRPFGGMTTFSFRPPFPPDHHIAMDHSFWKLTEENDMGQPVKAQTGKMVRSYTYDAWGYPAGRKMESESGGVVFDQYYHFEPANGNLIQRGDRVNNSEEVFAYDNLNRLKKITAIPANAPSYERTLHYALNGNIEEISDIGIFDYINEGKPYQISDAYPGDNAAQLGDMQDISYTSFRRPAVISQGDYTTSFVYNSRGDRTQMYQTHVDGGDLAVRHYLGGRCEVDLHEILFYLGGDAYTAPAVYKKEGKNWKLYYLCRDYQGSICALADIDGNKTAEYSYDPWGRMRNPQSMEVFAPGEEPKLFLGRGYTGHEHLAAHGLINMNARLYDPVVGRFLSPDPYIQDPGNSQNYNRYSYVLNNPLKYTDPSGEIYKWNKLVGAYMNEWGHVIQESDVWKYENGLNNDDDQEDGWDLGGSDAYRNGYYYYNPYTNQIRYVIGTGPATITLFTVNLSPQEEYVFQGGPSDDWMGLGWKEKTSIGISAFSFGSESKIALIDWAVKDYNKLTSRQYKALSKDVQLIKQIRALGKSGVKYLNGVKILGKASIVTNAAITVSQVREDFINERFVSAGARVVVFGVTYGAAAIPVAGPFISIGLGVADVMYGEYFYDFLK